MLTTPFLAMIWIYIKSAPVQHSSYNHQTTTDYIWIAEEICQLLALLQYYCSTPNRLKDHTPRPQCGYRYLSKSYKYQDYEIRYF